MTRSPSRPFSSFFFMGPRKRARHETVADLPSNGASPTAALPEAAAAPTAGLTNTSLKSALSTETVITEPLSNVALTPTKPGVSASSPAVNSVRTSGQVRKTRSWYASWPRNPKSPASIPQVALESIMGGTSKPKTTPDFSRFETKKPVDSSPSDPSLDAHPSAGSDRTEPDVSNPRALSPSSDHTNTGKLVIDVVVNDDVKAIEGESIKSSQRPGSGWLGWFGKTPTNEPDSSKAIPIVGEDVQKESPKEEIGVLAITTMEPESQPSTNKSCDPAEGSEQQQGRAASSSWFPFWSSTPSKPAAGTPAPEEPSESSQPVQEPQDIVTEDTPPPEPKPQPPPSAGSTWAFWSRESKSKSKAKEYCPSEPGEIAVIGEGSEDHPKPARAVEIESKTPSKQQTQPKSSPSSASIISKMKTKRPRPQSMDTDELVPQSPGAPAAELSKVETARKGSISKSTAPAKVFPPNLLLPSFHSTYQMKENPSILRQIAELLLRTRQPPAKHVFRRKETPKIKKALAIGIHGLFPASYLRPMIGQPTGTSIKFANHGAEAIRRWAEKNSCGEVEIEKIALEGEGKIGDRVDNLWRLLLNWIDHIRDADFIMICCHSQGVPVGVMLVGKLIDLGIITSAKIGVCAMAGVSLGPFPDYKSGMGMLMGSAAELWQFSNPESELSQRYKYALKEALSYGVRISYIGSIDDQLVPMESAVYSPATHPYIYRAVFIDGRIHTPDFIARLVGFALKLRNLGISDHGLIRELSVSLAGSLYGGEGHSRLYDDGQVYDLAVFHALETTDVKQVECEVQKHEGLTNPNPYHLPWIMRGLLEEDLVKTELTSETTELLKQFDGWKPTNKALKDVKYRLEAVRSKL